MKLIVFMLALFIAGCAVGVRNSTGGDTDPHTVASELASLGHWFMWVGGFVLALGAICRLPRIAGIAASLACPVLGLVGIATEFADLATIVTEAGGIAIGLGLLFIWLAGHPWVLGCTAVLAVVAFGVRHRYVLVDWLDLGKAPGEVANPEVKP